MTTLRRFLDTLYLWCGGLACFFLASIAVLVMLQIITRLLGLHVIGLIDYATYAMVASMFLGLALALKRGAHIRVSLVIGAVSGPARRWLEIAGLALGTAIMAYFAWYSLQLTQDSWAFGYRAMGLAATPLWIPQIGMTLGGIVGAIAFLDELVMVLLGRPPSYLEAETRFEHPVSQE